MRYLGPVLDNKWTFVPHFLRLVSRVRVVSASLGRLMPNLGGPGRGARHLYLGVVRSVALYDAPVWYPDMAASRRFRTLLQSAQWGLVVWAARGYQTIATVAAMLVTGALPWVLEARVYADAYAESCARRRDPVAAPWTLKEQEVRRLNARRRAVKDWGKSLSLDGPSSRAVGTIGPVLKEWVGRRCFGFLTFRAGASAHRAWLLW
ncbi:uncharacterized protein LOC105196409 [Solenopsis invicta]|uniref:uncharacterized protein LOC105196409 n=1 Tax=Solenopsis invicta TaxID=13686 RepID=UPI000595FD0A|nr:uncharacterized protein LOC105196409 [Solenopsis invicta]